MTKINFFSTILITCWFQIGFSQSSVLLDDFNRADNTTVGGGWTEAGGDAVISGNKLVVSTGSADGVDYVHQSGAGSYQTTFNNASQALRWDFNMRGTRTDPSGFDSGNYGTAVVIGGSSSTLSGGTGYAVVHGESGSTDDVRLVRYNGGLDLNSNLTDIISGGTDYGNNHLSVRVTFTPSSGTWELFVRNDGSSFADPATMSASNSVGTAVNTTYTGTSLPIIACYYNHAGAATENTFFDNFYIPVAATLPTELTFFNTKSATENSNQLSWQTATETNTSHFEIQRSPDAENWQTIGEVKAAGESRETKNYSFTDENPLPVSYYRLRSVDFDGAEQFSQIERVERSGATKAPYVLPTNVENETTVVFESELERDANVLIFDMMGRQVFSQSVVVLKGENRQTLNLGNLPKGAYTLQVSGETSAPARFIKM